MAGYPYGVMPKPWAAAGRFGASGYAGTPPEDATGQGTPIGGYYPFPYNQPASAAAQIPQAAPQMASYNWQPTELQRAATPYPGQRAGGAAGLSASAAKVAAARAGGADFSGRYPNLPMSYTNIPWGAGQAGNYMPGHASQDAQNAQQIASLYANQVKPNTSYYSGGRAGGGGSYSGYGGSGSGGLAGGYQSAQDQARAENEARYRDILGGYEARRASNQGSGSQEARDIDQAARARAAEQRQSLTSRGLSNSTVLDTMNMGVDRERAAAQGRLQDRLRAQNQQLLGDELAYMERRTDSYPDYNQLAALAQGMGAAGYGAGGVGGGGVDYTTPQQMGFQLPGQQGYSPAMAQMLMAQQAPQQGGVQGGAPLDPAAAKQAEAFRQQALLAKIAAANKQRIYRSQAGVGSYNIGPGTSPRPAVPAAPPGNPMDAALRSEDAFWNGLPAVNSWNYDPWSAG